MTEELNYKDIDKDINLLDEDYEIFNELAHPPRWHENWRPWNSGRY